MKLFVLTLVGLAAVVSGQRGYDVLHRWKLMDFQYPSEDERQEAISNGTFIPENNALTGIKVYKGETPFNSKLQLDE
jgi:hypothetical protein